MCVYSEQESKVLALNEAQGTARPEPIAPVTPITPLTQQSSLIHTPHHQPTIHPQNKHNHNYNNAEFDQQYSNTHHYNIQTNSQSIHNNNDFNDANYYDNFYNYDAHDSNSILRPFSASSNSCSSSEGELRQPTHSTTPLQQHIHAPTYSNCLRPHFDANCFNSENAHEATNNYTSEYKTDGPQYTSVIVEPPNFQLSNEYVH